MLENWLVPPDLHNLGITAEHCKAHQIGKTITIYSSPHENTEGGAMPLPQDIVLLGVNILEADSTRKHLYRMTNAWKNFKIWDLGNLIKPTTTFALPLIKELISLNISPILIGNDPTFSLAQIQSYRDIQTRLSFTLIDANIPYSTQNDSAANYLNTIFQLKKPHLQQCAIIGFQTHLVDSATVQLLEEKNTYLVRLGKARQQLDALEPTLRETNVLSLNFDALKYADAPAQLTPSVTGFVAEEICQLVRYAGASDSVSSFGLYGFEQTVQDITSQTAATIIWYFLDGFFNRQNDLPNQDFFTKNQLENLTHLTEYLVRMNELNINLSFYKSHRSERWWVQIPNYSLKKDKVKIKLAAVSYSDYLQACQGVLSERLFNVLK